MAEVDRSEPARLQEFTAAAKELDMIYRRTTKDASMSLATFNILTVLRECDGCTQKRLSDELFVPKQTVHSSVRAMERAGLVRLEAGRGREVRVCLTEEGHRVVEREVDQICQAEERAFVRFDADEQHQFVRLMRAFTKNLSDEFSRLGI